MMRSSSLVALCLLAQACLLLQSCTLLEPEKDPTRFAVLASIDELPGESAEARARSVQSLGLGPIVLPEYVRRAEIVTRVGGTRIVPSDTERWSEPIESAVERVLALDLARLLGLGRIAHYPWYSTERPEAQVEVGFSRFERDELGNVIVVARWILRSPGTSRPNTEKEFRFERSAGGSDGASTALAFSHALAELAGRIAGELAPGEEDRRKD
jgi:uncharacterized lipoprotein YmbA